MQSFNSSLILSFNPSIVGKKFALNIFYNLAIILSIFGLVWCYNNHKYIPAAFLVGVACCLFYFKYQLTKELRKNFKEKDQK
ncbi:DUF6358 family protein [Pedobacter miscanthi]|uniref:DUF6358 family protein n=1 Tax=Pedobacter miscanthi TaxID=2259170 RepID=UPI00292DB382|nr:DUF6358 family protein [Pedobacter miscanthi]